jgi:hypothetical protein
MNARTPYPYEHLRETASKKQETHLVGLKIDEVATDVSQSTGMSPLTEEYPVFMRHQSVKSEFKP